MTCFNFLRILFLSVLIGSFGMGAANAHPEDEFCSFDSGIDPALCRALQSLDRADPNVNPADERLVDLSRTPFETFALYIRIGAEHILPTGYDHILFVMALCFAAFGLRALLLQVSIFTLAHTATLGLVAAGVFTPDPAIVEPLIAITIAVLAVEVLIFTGLPLWRLALIFGFGLIHGMGFAGFFGTLGLPNDQFWSALIGFNIGAEIGQIVVILLTIMSLAILRRMVPPERFRHLVVFPACGLIAAIALLWTFERIFGG